MGVLEQQHIADQRWRDDVSRRLDEHFEKIEDHDRLLAVHSEKFARGNDRFEEGEDRMTGLETKVQLNNEMTERIENNIATMLLYWQNFMGFKAVSKGIFSIVVGASVFIIALGVIWYFLSTGQLPRKP